MFGDLDLIHMARDNAFHHAPSAPPASAVEPPPARERGLGRASLDSTMSSASTAAPLASSWGGYGASLLHAFGSPPSPTAGAGARALRHAASLPSQPVSIPGRRASVDYGMLSRRDSVGAGAASGAAPSSFAAGGAPRASAASDAPFPAPATPRGGGDPTPFCTGASPGGGHGDDAPLSPRRLPTLMRGLSRTVSESLDVFR